MEYFDTIAFNLAEFLPLLVAALLTFLVGWVIAVVISTIIRQGLEWMGIDRILAGAGMNTTTKQGMDVRPSVILASLAKWIIIIGAIGIAADIVNLPGVSAFTGTLLAYVPNVLIALIILIIGFLAASRIESLVMMSATLSSLEGASREIIGKVARYAIMLFAVMAALTQLNIVPRLIEIAFAGMIFALALAFGLGGREHASEWIQKMKKKSVV